MTRNLDARLSTYSPTAIAVFRVVVGLLFLCHGTSILFHWPVPPAMPVAVGQWPGYYAGLIELVTGALVAVGLFTRVAALVASGAMAYAYFTVHVPHGFLPMTNGGEIAVLYCFAFLLLAFIGPGRYALETHRSAIGGRWRRPRRGYTERPAAGTGRRGWRAGAPWSRWRRRPRLRSR